MVLVKDWQEKTVNLFGTEFKLYADFRFKISLIPVFADQYGSFNEE